MRTTISLVPWSKYARLLFGIQQQEQGVFGCTVIFRVSTHGHLNIMYPGHSYTCRIYYDDN